MKLFNKRRTYEKKNLILTEEIVKKLEREEGRPTTTYSDALCRGLRVYVGKGTNSSYCFQNTKVCKTIGNIYNVSLKEAREIVFNIKENLDEFYKNVPERCCDLYIDFKKNGFYPRKKVEDFHGTETVLSQENASLKEKIKDLEQERENLQKEIEDLQKSVTILGSRLATISHLANYDEADLEMVD